jgi:ABC-2 type transport system permease protein
MLNEIKYRIITIYMERQVAFWSLLFPIILGTLFSLAFGNIGKDIDTINTAIVREDNSQNAKTFEKYLKAIEQSESQIIKIKIMSEKEAVKCLKKKSVYGIFYAKESPELTVTDSGMQSSILRELLNEYDQNVQLYKNIASEHPENIAEIINDISYYNMSKEVGISGKEVDGVVQYYLALIAMACLFGGYVGYTIGIQLQANVNKIAIRRNVSSLGKLKMIVCDTLVGWGVQMVNVSVCILYLKYILKIDIGSNMPKMFIICAAGSLIGVSVGIFIGCLGNMGDEVKI